MMRQWHLLDARGQDVDKLGAKIAKYLGGMHKPIYHSASDVGDHVIVLNCRHVALRGFDWKHREYKFNNLRPMGRALLPAWQIQQHDPCRVLFMAAYSALPRQPYRQPLVERLHLYAEEDAPAELLGNVSNQMEQVQTVPKRLDDYSRVDRHAFPRLWQAADDALIITDHQD